MIACENKREIFDFSEFEQPGMAYSSNKRLEDWCFDMDYIISFSTPPFLPSKEPESAMGFMTA
ncbi:MAG: hypothetical protein EA412_00785 [Chitinophagaceae bacterium]|nr:MAG: hypothetical protein EA412_00785 [Chitinophagaceae bacterium]